jgi:hypothetical protein
MLPVCLEAQPAVTILCRHALAIYGQQKAIRTLFMPCNLSTTAFSHIITSRTPS